MCEGYTGPYMHINTVCKINQDFLDEFTINIRESKSSALSIKRAGGIMFVAILIVLVI